MARRIRYLAVFLVLCFTVLFLQLNNIQIRQSKQLSGPANPRTFLESVAKPRGDILTAGGVVVAESRKVNDPYKYLRVYPEGPLFADVTGFDSIIYGVSGLEYTYNSYLSAHTSAVHNLSQLLSSHTVTDNVILTVSNRLQQVAAAALGNRKGAVVAINPKTGAVLAMYSSPSYNPNLLASHNEATERAAWASYNDSPSQPMLARAYRQIYPPGSTFKMVTSSAVYDHDPSLATTPIPYMTEMPLPDSNKLLANYDHELCGGTIYTLFEVSCDTGFGTIGLRLGAANLVEQADAYGFNKVPPFDLPAVASQFPPASSFTQDPPALAYSAIGQQNVRASALQMALVASAIANGGVIMTPHVMAEIRSSDGRLVKVYKPHPWLRATPPSTAAAVKHLMVGVVEGRLGTAYGIFPASVDAAAKTGTAQNAPGQCCTNWLAAMAPASNPAVVVVAVVPFQPGLPSGPTGAAVAGPVVRQVLLSALKIEGRG